MSTSQANFPELLDSAFERERLRQTFGWTPVSWGAFLVVVSLTMPTLEPNPTTGIYALSAGLAIGGLLLVYHEFARRHNRAVLCVKGDELAVYRKGRLDAVITRNQILFYIVGHGNTVQGVIGLGMGATMFFVGASFAPETSIRVMAFVGGLAFSASMASAIWTRYGCHHFVIPSGSGRPKMVLIHRSKAQHLLG